MLKFLTLAGFLIVFAVVLTFIKELVMVGMSISRVELYLPVAWLRYAPYVVLAILVFPVAGWLFAKLFRTRTVLLSFVCGVLFLAVPAVYLLPDSMVGENLFLLLANACLALSFVFWVTIFARLVISSSRG